MARYESLTGAVSAKEKAEVTERVRAEGLKSESAVVRRVMLAWSRSQRVRMAVETFYLSPETGGVI